MTPSSPREVATSFKKLPTVSVNEVSPAKSSVLKSVPRRLPTYIPTGAKLLKPRALPTYTIPIPESSKASSSKSNSFETESGNESNGKKSSSEDSKKGPVVKWQPIRDDSDVDFDDLQSMAESQMHYFEMIKTLRGNYQHLGGFRDNQQSSGSGGTGSSGTNHKSTFSVYKFN